MQRVWLPVPAEVWRGALPSVDVVLAEMVAVALVEEEMTAKDRNYGGRTITLPQKTAERLEEYRKAIEEEMGVPISYHLAIAFAIKRAMERK